MWPGVVTRASMVVSATAARYLHSLGLPTHVLSGLFTERKDARSDGRNVSSAIKSFYEGQTFMYELVKALATRSA